MDDARFFQKLRAAFQVEASERIASLEVALDVLEDALALPDFRQHPEAAARMDAMYRELHSLKGAGRTVELPLLETLCQGLESLVWRIKRGDAALEFPLVQQLREAVVLIRTMVAAAAAGAEGPSEAMVTGFLRRLGEKEGEPAGQAAVQAEGQADVSGPSSPASSDPGDRAVCPEPPACEEPVSCSPGPGAGGMDTHTVRLPTTALESLLGQVEGLLTSKSAASLHAASARRLHEGLATQLRLVDMQMDSSSGRRPDLLALEQLARESDILARELAEHQRTIAVVVDELLESITQTLLLPWGVLLEGYPRMVREIASSQGKQVQLTVKGADTAIDRRILEQLGDVFLHLLRNAVDHGIESPEERLAAGKPAQGHIHIRIEVLGGDRARIELSDDGRGVDFEAVRRKAVERGLFTAEEAARLDAAALLELVWRPEFSTRDQVNHISGRGLGMIIVKDKLERVGGSAQLRTTPGQGSVISLHVPLSLMRFQGLVILCGGRRFVVRKSAVRRVLQAPRSLCDAAPGVLPGALPDAMEPASPAGMLVLDGAFIHVAPLARLLGLEQPAGRDIAERRPVLIVGEEADLPTGKAARQARGTVGLMIDAIVGEAEVTLRSLGPQLAGLRGLRGVVLMGDGELAPVLNLIDLGRMALEGAGAGLGAFVGSGGAAQIAPLRRRRPRRVLVAEDSITSRMLLKNVLETAGYVVVTAVDGQEALDRLRRAASLSGREDTQGRLVDGGQDAGPADGVDVKVDALVSDVEMPRMDGFALVRQIRADPLLAALPVVLVTSLADPAHQEAGMQAGADAYIVKSRFDQSDLLQALARLLPTV